MTVHGVRWVYEPTTFVLERDAEGRPTTCFNPDFYLPDHHRYLELTTMRQAHVTRKNRKLRLLRERFPSIDAHILYRRDVDRLAERCRVQVHGGVVAVGATRFTALEIAGRTRELGEYWVGKATPDAVITLGSGSGRFGGEVVAELRRRGVEPEVGELTLAGVNLATTAGKLRVYRGPRVDVERRRLLLVADVVSTGLTADFAIRWLTARGAGPVEVVAMVDRPAARIVPVPMRAAAFTIDDTIVAGHGMGADGRLAALVDIVEVDRGPG